MIASIVLVVVLAQRRQALTKAHGVVLLTCYPVFVILVLIR